MTRSAKMMMFVATVFGTPFITPVQAIELSCSAPFAPVIDAGSPITMAAEVDPTPLKEKKIDLELARTPIEIERPANTTRRSKNIKMRSTR